MPDLATISLRQWVPRNGPDDHLRLREYLRYFHIYTRIFSFGSVFLLGIKPPSSFIFHLGTVTWKFKKDEEDNEWRGHRVFYSSIT
jgi:hypothetical protein